MVAKIELVEALSCLYDNIGCSCGGRDCERCRLAYTEVRTLLDYLHVEKEPAPEPEQPREVLIAAAERRGAVRMAKACIEECLGELSQCRHGSALAFVLTRCIARLRALLAKEEASNG